MTTKLPENPSPNDETSENEANWQNEIIWLDWQNERLAD
jgi:hypothetical protein